MEVNHAPKTRLLSRVAAHDDGEVCASGSIFVATAAGERA